MSPTTPAAFGCCEGLVMMQLLLKDGLSALSARKLLRKIEAGDYLGTRGHLPRVRIGNYRSCFLFLKMAGLQSSQ